MQHVGFQEAVDKIRAEDSRYEADAYGFLRDALEGALKRRKRDRKDAADAHISIADLLDAFRVKALNDFGPMTLMVLDYWGVRSSEDIGQLVFNLVQAGFFGWSEQDSPEHFRGALDFDAAFAAPFRPEKIESNAAPLDIVPKKE